VDICVIFAECDFEEVQPLLSILKFNRADGSRINVFPHRKSHTSFNDAMHALDHAHAILLVLSDKACLPLTEPNAEENNFYKLMRKACERERDNHSRILPLFLYEIIMEEDNVGLVRFNTWAFKCKNDQARMYMEHIGSLQGLFSDPTEWESKWEKIYSFWQEAHNALEPLGCDNFQKELDCAQIRATSSGGCLGMSICCLALFFTCIPACHCCGPRWTYFKRGILGGNVFILLVFGLFLFSYGIYYHADCTTEACQDDVSYTRRWLLLSGLGFAATGLCMAAAFIGLKREETTLKEKLLEEGEL